MLLSVLTTACSGNGSSSGVADNQEANKITVTASTTPIPAVSPIITTSETHLAMDAYKRVLQNEDNFLSTDGKKILLNDYLKEYLTGKQLEMTHFTIIDLDGDNIPEVVLELSVDGNPQFYEILHYNKEQVYGYDFVYRGLERLKADGTFWASSGAADNECDKLKFNDGAYEIITLAHSESKQDDNGMTVSYYIDNQSVTDEAFNSFTQNQDAKDDVVWNEVSESNIEKELSISE